MIGKIRKWLDIRIGINELIRSQLTEYRVPKNINIFYTLGIVAFVAYFIQSVTGIFLLIFYIPHEDHAFKSVQYIMNTVPYGWFSPYGVLTDEISAFINNNIGQPCFFL